MLPPLLLFKATATGAVALLASCSLNNMSQTFLICRQQPHSQHEERYFTISQIKSMKRQDLLHLYLSSNCYVPSSLKDISGEWDGFLLDNNGLLMNSISSFITNTLFSRNRDWRGKAFGPFSTSSSASTAVGINRFLPRNNKSPDSVEKQHRFAYTLSPSKLDSRTSLVLQYGDYQRNKLSLWKSMMDELRMIEVYDDRREDSSIPKTRVLLGMGHMAWSGGVWNASPFMLQRVKG